MYKLLFFLRLNLFQLIVHILCILTNKYTRERLSKYPLFPRKNSYLDLYFNVLLQYNALDISMAFTRLNKGGLCN